MKLTKNQIYIISAIVIAVVIYLIVFRKKKTTATAKLITPPMPTPTPAESGYYGAGWGWGTGPQDITKAEALTSMSGPAGNSVAGLMESGYGANRVPNKNAGSAYASANKPWPQTFESNFNVNEIRGKGGAGYDWLTPAR
jgi:hypothetical protein